MLLWILLSIGLALGVVVVACVLATIRAERRARRNLYASLGVGEDLVQVLMARKGSVSVQLALVRQASISSGVRPEDLRRIDGSQTAEQRSFRFTRAPADAPPSGSERPALAPVRKPPAGRDPV